MGATQSLDSPASLLASLTQPEEGSLRMSVLQRAISHEGDLGRLDCLLEHREALFAGLLVLHEELVHVSTLRREVVARVERGQTPRPVRCLVLLALLVLGEQRHDRDQQQGLAYQQ